MINKFESKFNTGYTLVIRAKYIWMLKQSVMEMPYGVLF